MHLHWVRSTVTDSSEPYLKLTKSYSSINMNDLHIWGSFEGANTIVSSPGQSPGRAIVLPPASALAAAAVLNVKVLTLKFFI